MYLFTKIALQKLAGIFIPSEIFDWGNGQSKKNNQVISNPYIF
jgi:hypothetical protein